MIENKYLTLKNKAYLVQKLIEKSKKQNYPTPYLNDLFHQLGDIYLDFSKKYLDFESDADICYSDLVKISKFIALTNEFILTTLSNASHIRAPKSLTIPIRERLEGANSSAVYIPELIWETNYYIGEISSGYNRFIKSIGLDFELEIQLYRFGIPHFYQDDILMSGVLGHELGHYFDLYKRLNVTEKLLTKFVSDSTLIEKLIPYAVSEQGAIMDDDMKVEIVKLFLTNPNLYMKNWISEFVADVLGIMLYGPASFFSTEKLIQSLQIDYRQTCATIDNASKSHPSNLLRYQIMIKTFEFMKYKDYLPKAFSTEIKQSGKVWDDAKKEYCCEAIVVERNKEGLNMGFLADEGALIIIEEYLSDRFEMIVKKCYEEMPKKYIYQPKNMNESIEKLWEKLGQLLPPNEVCIGRPSDSITIINSGWLAYFEPSELLKTKYKTNDALLEVINGLLNRALEVASIHRRWLNGSTK